MYPAERDAKLADRSISMVNRHALIHYSVVSMIEKASRASSGQLESGGILIGSLRGPHLECTKFTTPGPEDRRSEFSFTRKDPMHQRAAEREWRKSTHSVSFIGEWHTHPSGQPIPSSIDTNSWIKLVRIVGHPMLFIIAAPRGWKSYLLTPGFFRCSIKPLSIIENGTVGIVLA